MDGGKIHYGVMIGRQFSELVDQNICRKCLCQVGSLKTLLRPRALQRRSIFKKESVHSVHEKAPQLKQIREIKLHKPVNYEAPDAMQQEMSERSVEIMSHYGPERPVKLNDCCCLLEDAYIKSIKTLNI